MKKVTWEFVAKQKPFWLKINKQIHKYMWLQLVQGLSLEWARAEAKIVSIAGNDRKYQNHWIIYIHLSWQFQRSLGARCVCAAYLHLSHCQYSVVRQIYVCAIKSFVSHCLWYLLAKSGDSIKAFLSSNIHLYAYIAVLTLYRTKMSNI